MCLSDDVESVDWGNEQHRVEPSCALPSPEDERYHVGTGRQFTLKAILLLTFVVALSLGMIRWAEFTRSTYKFSVAMTGTIILSVVVGAAIGYVVGIWITHVRR